jgi:hypothetical protein
VCECVTFVKRNIVADETQTSILLQNQALLQQLLGAALVTVYAHF